MSEGESHGFHNQRAKLQHRLKPTIYTTTEGRVIVEDEFLNFLAVKMKTMAQEEIVLIASSTFGSEWIEASKKVLFDLCPTKTRLVTCKGPMKDVNNIKSCLRVLNECGVNIPHFVSHNLDDLPPVTFNNLDVSNLLGKIESLHNEVSALRHSAKLQADIEEELSSRVAVLESRDAVRNAGKTCEVRAGSSLCGALGPPVYLVPPHCEEDALTDIGGPARCGGAPLGTHSEGTPLNRRSEGAPVTSRSAGWIAPGSALIESSGAVVAVESGSGSGNAAASHSPGPDVGPKERWTDVVKKRPAQRKRTVQQAAAHSAATPGRRTKPYQSRPKPIVGTGVQGTIKVVRKMVSVFATRFSPEVDAVTLSAYLGEKLGRVVNCERIGSVGNRYSSFKVWAECKDVDEMYKPDIWPEGSVVRRYYEPRKVGMAGTPISNASPTTDGANAQNGASAELS